MKTVLIFMMMLMFQGCSYATMRLVYSDAKVVYEDARYIVHEIEQTKEAQKKD